MVKEIEEVREAQRIPKKLEPRKDTPRYITITLPKSKDKGKNLKSGKRKGNSYLQRRAHKTIS